MYKLKIKGMAPYICFTVIGEIGEYRFVDTYNVPSDNKEISPEFITGFMSTQDEYGPLVLNVLEKWIHDDSVLVSIGDRIIWSSSTSGISAKFESPISISQMYTIWKSAQYNY